MSKIQLDLSKLGDFVSQDEIQKFASASASHLTALKEKTGKGNEFLGWVDLPAQTSETFICEIETVAQKLKDQVEVVVVIGIGGSYLGAKAINEALAHSFDLLSAANDNPIVLYAGQNISEDYLYELKEVLEEVDFGICVISKSGTTTEPALSFRVLKALLEEQVGREEAQKRIVAITDGSKGALRTLATQEGYQTFTIPDDVGGRFSVFTPVGLLPIACAGHDIAALMQGAKDMREELLEAPYEKNIALQYAAVRNALYAKGKTIEILVNYNPKLQYISEWWKQLYGESEGKQHKGIFPASVNFTTDLHSMGQYIQEGMRNLFETVISVEKSNHKLTVPSTEDNLDKLNYLAGKRMEEINKSAELATILAHVDGGVPNIRLSMEKLDAYNLGQLLYFFELACGISGYMLDVNPFDQPGVEAYKVNMFALLGKPGFEAETEAIKKKI